MEFNLLLQIHFGSGAALIRNDFFLIQIQPKVSDRTGSRSTTLLLGTQGAKNQRQKAVSPTSLDL
jgi:hypothetical protein